MLTLLLKYIEKEKLFISNDKVLLAVSGGLDSVVMCELFHKANLNFGIAHCNFQLRDKESDEDETFVESLAAHYNVSFHTTTFKTASLAKKSKTSIQVTARELRYKWFEAIRQEYDYNYIATAHHLNDSIETFLINFARGTGISGLHGILPKQQYIIRPLLFATREELETFAKKQKLNFREDSSNASDKYVRNKIRHHIVPVLKEINPGFEKTAAVTIQRLIDTENIYKTEIENKRASIVKSENNSTTISVRALKKLVSLNAYLYEFLMPFDFNASTIEEISAALNKESGKQFFSPTHRLIKDRDVLLIQKSKKEKPENERQFKITKSQTVLKTETFELHFKALKSANYELPTTSSTALIDFEKLEFPLVIRRWQQGDVFFPLGMKGKKKLSDFFIDKKLSLYQKENTWLLTSGDKIVWIIGLRPDDRFKITTKTKKVYRIEFQQSATNANN